MAIFQRRLWSRRFVTVALVTEIILAIAEFCKARDNVKRGSRLAQVIDKALKELDH